MRNVSVAISFRRAERAGLRCSAVIKFKPEAKLSVVLFVVLVLLSSSLLTSFTASAFGSSPNSTSQSRIWTDRSDYPPASVVTIYGTGFAPSTFVTLTVTNPDSSTDSWTVTSDGAGGFVTTFQMQVPGIHYGVTAKDGTDYAQVAFLDPTSIVLNISPTSGSPGTVVTLLTNSSGFTPGTTYAFCFADYLH